MEKLTVKKVLIILLHAFIGWALCGAIMGIGSAVTSMETTLILHAIGAPLFFSMVSFIYFKKFNYTSPLITAAIFLSFVIFMDVFVVALLIEQSFEMFSSILGSWLPFVLIFGSAYLTGLKILRNS